MNTQVEKVERVAKHELLDSAGTVTERFEDAVAIRYTDIASGDVIDFEPKGEAQRMLALFGARTLATNEASASRQKDGTSADQMDAIRERFAGMSGDEPKWVDRTREGGPRIDQPTLAESVVDQMVIDGKWTEDERATKVAKMLETMKADAKKVTVLRSLPGVEAHYKRRKGGKAASAADIAALVA